MECDPEERKEKNNKGICALAFLLRQLLFSPEAHPGTSGQADSERNKYLTLRWLPVTYCYANAVLNWSCVLEGFYQLHRLNFRGALKLLKEENKTERYEGSKAAYATGLYRVCTSGANCLTSLLFYVLYCLDIHIMSLLSFGLWNWSLDFSFQFISVGVQIYI